MKTLTEQNHRQAILRVLVHIQQHLGEAMPLSQLASVAHLSPYRFHRVFREIVGEAVKEHVRRLRIERAAFQLITTDQSITAIALDARYEAHESFTRAFRGIYNESPSSFRSKDYKLSYLAPHTEVGNTRSGHPAVLKTANHSYSGVEVRIRKIPPLKVAFIRTVGPYGTAMPTWERFMAWAREHRLLKRGTQCIGIGHDSPIITPAEKIRYDVCIKVPDDFVPEGDVGVQQIGGGEYAVMEVQGPYRQRFDAYSYLCSEWLPAHGRAQRSPHFIDIFRRGGKGNSVNDQATLLHVPLAPRLQPTARGAR